MNTKLGPKKVLKVLRIQKQAWLHKGQPNALFNRPANVPTTIATAASILPSTMSTTTIEAFSTVLGIHTLIKPDSPSVEDL